MGCGSSKSTASEDERARFATALSSHLADVLGLTPVHPDIQRYVNALNAEGWDVPAAFDDLSIDELKAAPFSFKPGHLKRVCWH